MTRIIHEYTFSQAIDPLKVTATLLSNKKKQSYYAYEYEGTWYIGLNSQSSLIIDSTGETGKIIDKDGKEHAFPVTQSPGNVAKRFISEHGRHGKVFGQVGFNYGAHTNGQAYETGKWPILSLMIPRTQVTLTNGTVKVTGYHEGEARDICSFIQGGQKNIKVNAGGFLENPEIRLQKNSGDYKSRVAKVISDIEKGIYSKAVISRVVPLPSRVNMPATLLQGRCCNSPVRTFSLSHMGIQATGFSPEILLSVKRGVAYTEVVAGTKSVNKSDPDSSRCRLLDDNKEVLEHVTVVKGFSKRLAKSCVSGCTTIKDFMTVIDRGNVHHLYSHVSGLLADGRSAWDTLADLLGSITSPAPDGRAIYDTILAIEPRPRDLYFGAVILIDPEDDLFEATLVLRTVFQDANHQWLQAGAAITRQSTPEREFAETCEKLMSIAPYVVLEQE